jgi:hypothetical protein
LEEGQAQALRDQQARQQQTAQAEATRAQREAEIREAKENSKEGNGGSIIIWSLVLAGIAAIANKFRNSTTNPSPGLTSHSTYQRRISKICTSYLEMELDLDTNTVSGIFLAGRLAGKRLEDLDVQTLIDVLTEIDDESRDLLMAYLDRRDPYWKDNINPQPKPKQKPKSKPQPKPTAEMLRKLKEAMVKAHPDKGGDNESFIKARKAYKEACAAYEAAEEAAFAT